MPYIRKDARERYDAHIDALRLRLKLRPIGDLTYVIYRLVKGWIAPDKRYAAFAQALGSLRSVSFEIERRHLAPYEDGKIEENGDA